MITLIDALAVQAKYRNDYAAAIDHKHALVDRACRDKSHLPDNYWLDEHMAGRKLDIVNGLVDALREG